jgi:hypothetical protein
MQEVDNISLEIFFSLQIIIKNNGTNYPCN